MHMQISIGMIQRARYALTAVQEMLATATEKQPEMHAALSLCFIGCSGAFAPAFAGELAAHAGISSHASHGIRMFALYVNAHYTYLQKDYQKSLGIVEATLGMQTEEYPIPCIYLHLVAVMDYMSLKQIDKAKQHLLAAWELARPDDLIEGFGEHHGLLGGMLEAVIKPAYRRILSGSLPSPIDFLQGGARYIIPIPGTT